LHASHARSPNNQIEGPRVAWPRRRPAEGRVLPESRRRCIEIHIVGGLGRPYQAIGRGGCSGARPGLDVEAAADEFWGDLARISQQWLRAVARESWTESRGRFLQAVGHRVRMWIVLQICSLRGKNLGCDVTKLRHQIEMEHVVGAPVSSAGGCASRGL
jgi:hypothetical protein